MVNPRELAKAILPARARARLRAAAERASTRTDTVLVFVGRHALKRWRSLSRSQPRQGIIMAMLCIRNPVYVRLAVSSINSLHYHNHMHRVSLYLDHICFAAFERLRKKLDYPQRVRPILIEDNQSMPWQFTKLDVVLTVSSQGIPFVDADSRWHGDPSRFIIPDRAMFLVEVNKIGATESEGMLVAKGLGRPEWIDFRHFNTGFIAIPKELYSEQLASECRSLARKIHTISDEMQFSPEQTRLLKHTCEELALSLTAQEVIGGRSICTLKENDGPGNRTRLESYYVGALNKVQ